MTKGIPVELQWTHFVTMRSKTDTTKKYQIYRNQFGDYKCECMSWRFNKDTPKRCKHTDIAHQDWLNQQAGHPDSNPLSAVERAADIVAEILKIGNERVPTTGNFDARQRRIMNPTATQIAAMAERLAVYLSMPTPVATKPQPGITRLIEFDD
jgi:hypothetical protein